MFKLTLLEMALQLDVIFVNGAVACAFHFFTIICVLNVLDIYLRHLAILLIGYSQRL